MLSLRRRQLLQSLAAGAGLSAIPTLGCSANAEEEEVTLDELDAKATALSKVKKIVILMMENRSFDHYFGHLSIAKAQGGEGVEKYDYDPRRPDQRPGDRRVNGLTGSEWNPKAPNGKEADGVKVFYAHDKQLGYSIGDINHEWVECHNQWNPVRVAPGQLPKEGKMDGFIIEQLRDRGELGDLGPAWGATCDAFQQICADGTQNASALLCGAEAGKDASVELKLAACGHADSPMSYYKRSDTPVFHAIYDRFVLCDNWYASVCGPTWPNRYYVHSGTAGGAIGTDVKRDSRHDLDTIFKVLRDSNINFYNFYVDAPLIQAMYGNDATNFADANRGMANVFAGNSPAGKLFVDAAKAKKGWLENLIRSVAQDRSFEERCKVGDLPPVSYIEPPYFSADDHPPHDIQMGQAFVKSVYNMLYGKTANRKQASETLLVIMYDEHGSFYDHQDPGVAFASSSADKDADRNFKPLGFRVPAMVLGPMVKKAHVSHTVYDHSSVLRTIYNWAAVHASINSGIFTKCSPGKETPCKAAVRGVQTREMIDEVYRAGFPTDHPLRPLHAQQAVNVIHKPMLRVLAANDISDCLDPNYEGTESTYNPGTTMPFMPEVKTKEGLVLASMQFSHGQAGVAAALGVKQPSFRQKTEAVKIVMEHMYRLGAINIG